MNLVINDKNQRIRATDIKNYLKTDKYHCTCCNEQMIYVNGNENRICHFRHHPNSDCVSTTNKEYAENKKSDFHFNWQKLFPNDNTEVYFCENNKKHIADIYLENELEKLVVEIQHSPICQESIDERTNFYKSNGRKLLWIFDITKKAKVEKIITHQGTTTLINLKSKCYFKNIDPEELLLDDGSEYLYKIKKINNFEFENIEIDKKIKRKKLIKKFIKIIKKPIEIPITPKSEIIIYDCENIIKSFNIDNKNKDILRILLNLFVRINPELYDFKLFIQVISNLTNRNSDLFELIQKIIDRNASLKDIKVKIGKHNGKYLSEIPNDWKKWSLNNLTCIYKKNCNKCKNCKVLKILEYNLVNEIYFNSTTSINDKLINLIILKLELLVNFENLPINMDINTDKLSDYKAIIEDNIINYINKFKLNNNICKICETANNLINIINEYKFDMCYDCLLNLSKNFNENSKKFDNIIEDRELKIKKENEERQQKIKEEYEENRRQELIKRKEEFENKKKLELEKKNDPILQEEIIRNKILKTEKEFMERQAFEKEIALKKKNKSLKKKENNIIISKNEIINGQKDIDELRNKEIEKFENKFNDVDLFELNPLELFNNMDTLNKIVSKRKEYLIKNKK
jgi:competence CoiA-like predicted nuclease